MYNLDRILFGCPASVSALGVGLSSLSLLPPAASLSAQSRFNVNTVYDLVDSIGAHGKVKRLKKCLAVEDYF